MLLNKKLIWMIFQDALSPLTDQSLQEVVEDADA
jgi:hypothetical protein